MIAHHHILDLNLNERIVFLLEGKKNNSHACGEKAIVNHENKKISSCFFSYTAKTVVLKLHHRC